MARRAARAKKARIFMSSTRGNCVSALTLILNCSSSIVSPGFSHHVRARAGEWDGHKLMRRCKAADAMRMAQEAALTAKTQAASRK
jgi:hypothetical protein